MSLRVATAALLGLCLLSGGSTWAATLRARVYFTGKAPRMGALKRTDGACGGSKFATDEYAVVDPVTGALKNVLVWVSRGAPTPSPPRDAEFSSQACMFRPRVAAVTPGGVVRVQNTDNLPHLWHGFLGTQTVLLNKAEPGAAPLAQDLKTPAGQFVRLRDDTRPWMEGFVVSVESAFFGVTTDKGEVLLPELPVGSYTLSAWHERYGLKTQEVTVAADGTLDIKFLYDGTEVRP